MDLAKFLRRDSVRALIFDEVFVESFGVFFSKQKILNRCRGVFQPLVSLNTPPPQKKGQLFPLLGGGFGPLDSQMWARGGSQRKMDVFLHIKLHVMYLYTYLLQKLSASLLSVMKSRPLIGQSC